MWNSALGPGGSSQRDDIVKSPPPLPISCTSFSMVLISSVFEPRPMLTPGSLNVTVVPLSTAVPRRMLHDGARVPLLKSSTKSGTPSCGPNSLPSIWKPSQDELKGVAKAPAGSRTDAAATTASSRQRRDMSIYPLGLDALGNRIRQGCSGVNGANAILHRALPGGSVRRWLISR